MATSDAPATRPASTADTSLAGRALDYAIQTYGVAAAEVQKLRHDPFELATRAVQPALIAIAARMYARMGF
jgi:ABC-2 type transport system permease protein